ncbi:MAG: zinc ribbon domain-containing protein, partial [Blastocatellia bacterium]
LGTSPLDIAVRRPGLAEPAKPNPEPLYEIPPDEAPTVLLSKEVAAALGAALASEPAEERRTGNLASRLTGALERLGLRIGRTGRLCSACSTPLPRESRFCPHCGEATEHEAVMCWNCFDTTLSSSARFCPRCGVLVHRAPTGT